MPFQVIDPGPYVGLRAFFALASDKAKFVYLNNLLVFEIWLDSKENVLYVCMCCQVTPRSSTLSQLKPSPFLSTSLEGSRHETEGKALKGTRDTGPYEKRQLCEMAYDNSQI